MNQELKSSLKSFLIELVVYGALVVGYFFLVLNFLGDWLYRIFQNDHALYAAVALGLIVGQGIVLEVLTRFLLDFIKPRTKE
jgi:hypothetical protein